MCSAGDSFYALSLSTVLFNCHEGHQYLIRGRIIKPVTCVEPFPSSSGNVMQMMILASKNSGSSLTSKWRLLLLSCFMRFHYTRRFAGTQSPCIAKVTFTVISYEIFYLIFVLFYGCVMMT
jgi:hypothetical protein